MTASSTVLSIANRSLLSIGARAQVQSLSEGSTESNAISVLYQPTYESLARSANWNCLRQQATLTLIAAAKGTPENVDGLTLPLPPVPWAYQYALPNNCLDVRYILPSNPGLAGGIQMTTASIGASSGYSQDNGNAFAVAYAEDPNNNPLQVILTNTRQAEAVCTVNQPNPVIFDSLFEAALVASLAAYLVPALSLNIPLMQLQIKVAEAAIAHARVRDGDEGTTCQDHIPDWMSARSSGTRYGSGWGGRYNGYQDMQWPG